MASSAGVSEVRVRDARREDVPLLHAMIHELAAYEGFPDGPRLTVEDLLRDGFDESPPWYFALIAERVRHEAGARVRAAAGAGAGVGAGVEAVGYAICNRAYSSWTNRALYVEDLYVVPAARRAGHGRLLFQHIAQKAVSLGASRIDWQVAESNTPAMRFYVGLGARDLRSSEGRAALRLDHEHIHRLAAAISTFPVSPASPASPASPTVPAPH